MKKAIAYTSDIILGRTGEVIKRTYQAELIQRYAAENGVEIVAWFEDEMYDEDVLTRPGIQAMLSCKEGYDMVLCERVWAFSRSMTVLEPLFRELERRDVKLESATTMWDCVSQKCRRRFDPLLPQVHPAGPAVVRAKAVHVHRPAHMHFTKLVKAH
jgi:DNA invertase Pin-like site-specific DNA recombinase